MLRLLVFGLTMTSSWGNGHATVYRGLLKALHAHHYEITFFERDVPYYRNNRDLWDAPYCSIVLYNDLSEIDEQLRTLLPTTDIALVGSYCPDGIALLDRLAGAVPLLAYYDIDTPVTLAELQSRGATSYLRGDQLAHVDLVLSFTGGLALDELQTRWGVRRAVLFPCAIDPQVHHPVPPDERFTALLSYMGTYAADRQPALQRLLFDVAGSFPTERFVVAGPQYPPGSIPPGIVYLAHLAPPDHAAFYCSATATLNVTRAQMVLYGYAPSVRLFEAAGCGACTISDRWVGLDTFFEEGAEILVADTTGDALAHLHMLREEPARAVEIGAAARRRVLAEHTYEKRAIWLDTLVHTLMH